MQKSNHEWKSKYFNQTTSKEECCLICKRISIDGNVTQLDIWKNQLISEDHLENLYNQLLKKIILGEGVENNINQPIDQNQVFDYPLAKSILMKRNSKCSNIIILLYNYFEQCILQLIYIQNKKISSQTTYCNILKRFYYAVFQKQKGWYQEIDLQLFLEQEAFKQKSIQAINLLNYLKGKQMSFEAKQIIKYNIQLQNDIEQIKSTKFLNNCGKLISLLISDNLERIVLLFYLLFEFDIDIFDIPHLIFDDICKGLINLQYDRQAQKISKAILVSDQIKSLSFCIMKKHDLKEQDQIVKINSNREIQTMLECLKKTYSSRFQEQKDEDFLGFLKTFKLSEIKKQKKLLESGSKCLEQKSNNADSIQFINLFLIFETVIKNYVIINNSNIQSPSQLQVIKKSKFQLDLVRIQHISKIQLSTALVLMIDDDQVQDKQNLEDSSDHQKFDQIANLLSNSSRQINENIEIKEKDK